MINTDVVVVGGGISGLVAAYQARSAGVSVALVEKSSRLGGVVLTEKVGGYLIEAGPDSFVTSKGSVMSLIEELGLSANVISTSAEHRGAYVWWDGRLHPLPDGLLLMAPTRIAPLFRSSLLSPRGKIRVLADLVLPRGGSPEDESLESFVVRRLGRETLERIAEPLIAGIHAAEPATMSLRASFPRFLEMERRHRSLILAARSAARRPVSDKSPSYFASLRGGMGEMTDALVDALSDIEVVTDTAVVRLTVGAEGNYGLELSDGNTISARAVVLATPAPVTSRLLADVAPDAADALSGIHQLKTPTVTLAYQTADLPALAGTGFVVPAAQRRSIKGVSYMSQKWVGRAPDGHALLRVFMTGTSVASPALDAERLVDQARDDLRSMLGVVADPVVAKAHIWEEGLHQYTLGHLDRVRRAEESLHMHPGLAMAGSGFHGIGLNECIDSGRAATSNVLDSLNQRRALLSERAQPRTGGAD